MLLNQKIIIIIVLHYTYVRRQIVLFFSFVKRPTTKLHRHNNVTIRVLKDFVKTIRCVDSDDFPRRDVGGVGRLLPDPASPWFCTYGWCT